VSNTADVSDIYVNSSGHLALPMRSEKVAVVQKIRRDEENELTARTVPFTEYISLRIPGRGGSTPGVFDAGSSAVYSFLIAPSDIQVSRQILDEQSFSRSGWQIGVWGEDFISITLNGKTPGKYYENGLTDQLTPFTVSYRNLLALEVFVENNGYWFEGEEQQSNLIGSQSSKRIKMHSDVELTKGEFIWSGMFESFEITEDADSPYLADFSLVFIAWKESFRDSSPYPNSLPGGTQRGHVPMVLPPVVPPDTIAPALDTANSLTLFDPSTGEWDTTN